MKNRGFTLIETLVAITILVFAVATPLTLAAQSLFVAHYAKDQLIASHLAQEALEVVRQKRDHNLMLILKNTAPDKEDWLLGTQLHGEPNGTKKIVTVDVANITNTPFVLVTNQSSGIEDNDAILQHNGSIYLHDTTYGDTRFRRVVELERVSDSEIKVVAKVKWQTGAFSARTFTIGENLYNWVPL